MDMIAMISALARNRVSRQACTAKGRHRLPFLPAAYLFVLFILPLVMMPPVAESASWKDKWNNIKKQGEQIYEDTVEVITFSSEEQPEQPAGPAIEPQQSYSKVMVYEAQRLLTGLGYKPGPIDGDYGAATADAIRAYQADHGLEQTGEPTEKLLAHMTYALGTKSSTATTPAAAPTGSGQPVSQAGSTASGPLPGGVSYAKWSSSGPFAGFTLIRLKDIEAAHAIAGNYSDAFWRSADIYLITFVAKEGTYAAVGALRGGKRCVAWSAAGGGDGKSITFGINMDAYEGRPGIPWCQPFTVILQDGNKVQVVADNDVPEFGLKGRDPNMTVVSKRISHAGIHDIVLRLPVIQPDFRLPAFVAHAIYNISLGPITPRDSSPRIQIKSDFPTHSVEIKFTAFPDKSYGGNLHGRAAPAELGRWANDILIALWNSEKVSGHFLPSNKFNGTYIERYGQPTLFRNSDRRYGGQANGMWWLYDKEGRLLSADDASAENCLATFELWHDNTLWTLNKDIGPWGCTLVKYVRHDAGNYPTVAAKEEEMRKPGSRTAGLETPAEGHNVGKFREEMVAGDAMAYHHFMVRLGELAEAREKLSVAVSDGRKIPVDVQMDNLSSDSSRMPSDGKSKFEIEGVSLGISEWENGDVHKLIN